MSKADKVLLWLTSHIFNFQFHKNDDLCTIDFAALASLTENMGDFIPLPPSTPLAQSIPEKAQFKMPETVPDTQLNTLVTVPSLTPTPLPLLTPQSTMPVTVPSLTPAAVKLIQQDSSVQEQLSWEVPIDDEFVRSCVTPRKFFVVRDVLYKETELHKCTLKLLPYFFSCMELSSSNILW